MEKDFINNEWMPEKPEPPQSSFSPEEFFADFYWHQQWEVFKGVFTPGRNPVALICNNIKLPNDLRGKRVLDIGAWNGCFSFECERRGADEIIAFGPENPDQTGFNRLKEALKSKVKYQLGSVYDLNPDIMGRFDIVLFLGVLYHLRYPLLAIDQIKRIANDLVFIETHVIDNCFIEVERNSSNAIPLKKVSLRLIDVPIWQFYKGKELGDDFSNWFGPNIKAVMDAFKSAGFDIELLNTWGTRGSFRAISTKEVPAFLSHGSYEGNFIVIKESINLNY
jgi:tRNA (mo5U34)-methyltransferase